MRIGLMLRAIDEKGGVGVYTRNIVNQLLFLDRKNEYVFFYQNQENLGRFSNFENVQEKVIPGNNKAYWDQIAIPRACRKERIDVLFHPKFTAPLLAPCNVVMTVHGADWFIPEQAQYYTAMDVRYMRLFLPLYFKKCHTVISVSQLTTDNFNQVLRLPPGKVQTVYFGPAPHFERVKDKSILKMVKDKYHLPEHFILTLTKRKGDGRKNLGQIFKAYTQYHNQTKSPSKLVIGGKDCHLFRSEYGLPVDKYGADIHFPGWIDQADLPAVYTLADLYLYPSNLEAFPIPITEAMACGTPIITSNVNGLKEIAGDAAVFVDPRDATAISSAIHDVINDVELQANLSSRGLVRSQLFNWEICARKTLQILEGAVR